MLRIHGGYDGEFFCNAARRGHGYYFGTIVHLDNDQSFLYIATL